MIFNLAIGIPNTGSVATEFALSLSQVCMALQKHRIKGYDGIGLQIIAKKTSILPKSRQEIVEDAIKAKCTHVLFVDSDQVFPGSTVHRLAQWGKQVVGCNVATKVLPSAPTVRNESPDWFAGSPVYSTGARGLEEVWRIGCGILLIDL